ncbi:fimbrial chaperone protein/chaperone protein EcpD [Acinetobacter calcoaceticus]|uniref:Fimbrial chaperone protein/chaperone protein EcpD n=1 Tax=Acinetobacter calcoaceticus TaxID=471 RepID=A0A4R1XD12_ACICA|nr:fimbrial chaperone protein/chaperone protein EcpD [Acinetobacter calcoaceticus]
MHRTLIALMCGLFMVMTMTTYAGVTVQGTRIIVPSNAKSVSVQLQNQFDTPALVQVWLDKGDMNVIPDASQIPFLLTPALTRVEANSGQVIRILPLGTPELVQDRESLFIFNLLDIPPEKAEDANSNVLSFNVRTRLKLFYRPHTLKMSQDKGFQALKFQYDAKNKTLQVNNPTPYYMNLSKIILNPQQQKKPIVQALMVEPFEKANFTNISSTSDLTKIQYFVLNDLGGENTYTTSVTTTTN